MKLIADNNTNVTNQLEILESLVTWPASFKKNIPANKNGCRALSIDFVGRAALEIQILYTWDDPLYPFSEHRNENLSEQLTRMSHRSF